MLLKVLKQLQLMLARIVSQYQFVNQIQTMQLVMMVHSKIFIKIYF